MDDGPSTQNASLRMLHKASEDGISHIIATPHAHPGIVEFDKARLMRKVSALNGYSVKHGLGVKLYAGAEVMYTEKAAQHLAKGAIPTLAGSEYVLVEFDPDVEYEEIYQAMRSLTNSGFVPVMAHAERYNCLLGKTKYVEELKSTFYIRVQMNCSAVLAGRSRLQRKFIAQMIKKNLVDYVATDSHNTSSRPSCMDECYEYLADNYSERYARKLTENKDILLSRKDSAE